MRRIWWTRRVVILTVPCLLASLLFCAPGAAEDPAPGTSVVFLVRHAEKARDGSKDPKLTEEGKSRAGTLAVLLGMSGVTHLYSTEFQRTRATLEPLSEELGVSITVIPSGDSARQIAALLGLPPGSVAVVAGHSNTLPALVRGLGGEIRGTTTHPEYGEMIGDQEYDRLFQVILPAGGGGQGTRTLELRFGMPSPREP